MLGDRPSELVRYQRAGGILVGIRFLQGRVHDGDGIRQGRAKLVMIGDDQIDAELARHVGGFECPDAAIDGDQKTRARLG